MSELTELYHERQRVEYLESLPFLRVEGIHGSSYPVNNVSITAGSTYTTGSLWGSYGIPSTARGIVGAVRGSAASATAYLIVESGSDTPDLYSSYVESFNGALGARCSGLVFVRIGTSGTISLKAVTANFTGVYMAVVGYWI